MHAHQSGPENAAEKYPTILVNFTLGHRVHSRECVSLCGARGCVMPWQTADARREGAPPPPNRSVYFVNTPPDFFHPSSPHTPLSRPKLRFAVRKSRTSPRVAARIALVLSHQKRVRSSPQIRKFANSQIRKFADSHRVCGGFRASTLPILPTILITQGESPNLIFTH
jgi:hypothetical protein